MANVIKLKRGSGSDPSASDMVLGEPVLRTDTAELFFKKDNGTVAKVSGGGGGGGSDIFINTLSSSSGSGGGSATFNGTATRFTLSNPPSVSAQQLLVSVNGVIQKPNSGTSPSEGFAIDGNDIIFASAPNTGSDFFIVTYGSLNIAVPADNSVTSAKIADGAIVNADINASAAIVGTKIDPDFGSQNIVTTGNITGTGNLTIDTSAFFVNASNNFIGIGTATPTDTAGSGHCVDIKGGSSGTAIYLRDSSNNTGQIDFANSNMTIRTRQATPILFNVNNSERMRIDSSGRLLIGQTSSNNSTSMLQLKRANNNTIRLANSDATATNFVALDLCPANSLIGARIVATADGTFSSSSAEDAHLKFFTTADGTSSERMRIDTNGAVHIKSAGTSYLGFTGSGDAGIIVGNGSVSDAGLQIRTGTSGTCRVNFGDGEGSSSERSRGFIHYTHSDDSMQIGVNSSERMRIDSSGRVGIGTTSPQEILHVKAASEAINTRDGVIFGSTDSLAADKGLPLVWTAHIGTDADYGIASICGRKENATSDNGAGYLQFGTGDAPGAINERMRITSSGLVGIGTTSPQQELHIVGDGDACIRLTCTDGGAASFQLGDASDTVIGGLTLDASDNSIQIRGNNNAERMRIDSSGRVMIGLTSTGTTSAGMIFSPGETSTFYKDSGTLLIMGGGVSQTVIQFRQGGTNIGSITKSTTNVSFNTSASDRSLKKNFESWNENVLNLFKNINPQKFNFIEEEDTEVKTKGYIAQDLVDSFPEAYPKGDDDKYMFNPSGMVVYLMKALQEAIGRIEALEAK